MPNFELHSEEEVNKIFETKKVPVSESMLINGFSDGEVSISVTKVGSQYELCVCGTIYKKSDDIIDNTPTLRVINENDYENPFTQEEIEKIANKYLQELIEKGTEELGPSDDLVRGATGKQSNVEYHKGE